MPRALKRQPTKKGGLQDMKPGGTAGGAAELADAFEKLALDVTGRGDEAVVSATMRTGQVTQVGTRHPGNEDRGVIIEDLLKAVPGSSPCPYVGPANDKISIFGVYDGHGGDLASDWASNKLHKYFATLIRQGNYADAVPVALGQAFARCEQEFCDWSEENDDTSGSCATMVVLRGNQVFVGNAGDSKCVVFPVKAKSRMSATKQVDLNPRHGTELKLERKRILAAGGKINSDGAVFGVLYPSRGFGDIDVKALKKGVVTAVPEGAGIEVGSLYPQPPFTLEKGVDTFLINASDGLWDFVEDSEVIKLSQKNAGKSEKDIAALLLKQARVRGSDDDITIVVVRLIAP